MKKILTIAGTRPEVIRLSEVIKKLDMHSDHIFIHTGQNFTPNLHDQFFEELELRRPDYQFNLEAQLTGISFIAQMLLDIEMVIKVEKPDVALILGDTNSALSALVCKKYSIPVYHMEAGNRCYDENVPEETNRKLVDSLATFLLPYTQRSRENLLSEGYHPSKIIVTGNPISEIIHTHVSHIQPIQKSKNIVLVTLHRNENVSNEGSLKQIIQAINTLAEKYSVSLSLHPKLEEMLCLYKISLHTNIEASKPFGFFDFIAREQSAFCVITDSGTVPEECAILGTPCLLIRDSTERPELLETGSMIVSGIKTQDILDAFDACIQLPVGRIPDDYKDFDISNKIVKLLLGKNF